MPKSFSTKNLRVVRAPADERAGVGVFEFTDDYSIFHFGKLPDRIPGKGESSCRIAVFNFELLARAGVPGHCLGFQPPNRMVFTLLRRLDPALRRLLPTDVNHVVPLQVIFRNTIPPGSSVLRRIELGRLVPADLGLAAAPEPGAVLDRPVIEYTTKLEEIDRFVTRPEAGAVGGLTDAQLTELEGTTRLVDEVMTAHAEEVGLELADGKIEFGRAGSGELVLVDHAGTPDEARLLLDGHHVGKQVMRDHYVGTGLQDRIEEWVREGRSRQTWPPPEPLPAELVELAGEMYRSLCELWTGARIWGAPDLDKVLDRLAGGWPWT